MSPARKKSKSSGKARPKRPARPARKPAAKPKAKAGKPKAGGKLAKGMPERRRCVAMDPFGDPCQSAPRPGSTHCTIHSYLDR